MKPGSLFLEALRLDREPWEVVLRRAENALALDVAGFLLFGGSVERVPGLIAELRRKADRPLWFAADLERGAGQQFRGAADLPPPGALARHPRAEETARWAGAATARQARALGVNWVLAPVLDLDVEAANPIVGTRSFGADPVRVGCLGKAWVNGCQEAGVAACAKHFPGHGRTLSDSHIGLPLVSASRAELEDDVAPFRAVAGLVAGIMTAHVAYPGLEAEGAATFSPSVLTGLLRRELGFPGLILSDAMVMSGFRLGRLSEGDLAARAIAAGCDLLLYPRDLALAVEGLAAALERDPSLARRADDARRRNLHWCVRFEARGAAGPAAGGGTAPEPAGRALRIALECMREVGDVPVGGWSRERNTRVSCLLEDALPASARTFGARLIRELRALGWKRIASAPVDAPDPEDDGRRSSTAVQRLLMVVSTPRAGKSVAGLTSDTLRRVAVALERDPETCLFVFGHPRILRQIGARGVCAWSSEPLFERAAARWLDERVG
ncbi:MAG: glycoside hydrolase family 3 N-terminal domain-containing protein [Gemmatimonadota bacterium]